MPLLIRRPKRKHVPKPPRSPVGRWPDPIHQQFLADRKAGKKKIRGVRKKAARVRTRG